MNIMPITIFSGFECTKINAVEDVLSTTRHDVNFVEDLQLVKSLGITMLRVGVPWHRIEKEQGTFDWCWLDSYMAELQNLGIEAIMDPLHHCSFPNWLKLGFLDDRFVAAYTAFFFAVLQRYPYVNKYTIINEATVTAHFSCAIGIWPPYRRGKYDDAMDNIHEVLRQCSWHLRHLGKQHWYIDACMYHQNWPDQNLWRFNFLDRVIKDVKIDVLGLDYYAHCEFQWQDGNRQENSSPVGFAAIATQYYYRYNVPVALTETNVRGFVTDRQSWFVHMYQQCQQVVNDGIPFMGMCWYGFIDSTDWDTLLKNCNHNIDPVGIIWLDNEKRRHESEFSDTIKRINNGEAIENIRVYDYQPPLDIQLQGFKQITKMPEKTTTPLTLSEKIMQASCQFYGCTKGELCTLDLQRRKIVIFLLRRDAVLKLSAIARMFNYTDHSWMSVIADEVDTQKEIYTHISHDIKAIRQIVGTLL